MISAERYNNGELERFGDGEGVLVGGFVETIQQRESVFGTGGVPVEQGGGGADEGRVVAAIEEFAEVAGEETALGPLHAVAEDDLAEGEEDDPTRGLFLGENPLGKDFLPRRGRLKVEG